VESREEELCGRKMWRCGREVVIIVEISCGGRPVGAVVLVMWAAMMSWRRRIEKVVERSSRITADCLPKWWVEAWEEGSRERAMRWWRSCVLPEQGVVDVSSIIGGGFFLRGGGGEGSWEEDGAGWVWWCCCCRVGGGFWKAERRVSRGG